MKEERSYFFDKPRNINIVLYTLYIVCGLLLLFDFVVHRHIVHHWEELIGFYPIYGFVGCTLIVLGSKVLRTLVQRDEDYYEREEPIDKHGENDVVT